jgi:nitroreductase
MSKSIESLKWRYATKKFDSQKKIPQQDLETLKQALQLSASSYGMQFYKFLLIKNPQIREKLVTASWGQEQVRDASDLIVMCSTKSLNDSHIDESLANISTTRNTPIEKLSGYSGFIKSKVNELDEETKKHWIAKQVYIALGVALSMCAELKIDSCPMEGFDPVKYDEIIGLSARGLEATLVLPIGYRSEEDVSQHLKKVRKSERDLFEIIE